MKFVLKEFYRQEKIEGINRLYTVDMEDVCDSIHQYGYTNKAEAVKAAKEEIKKYIGRSKRVIIVDLWTWNNEKEEYEPVSETEGYDIFRIES